MQFLGQNFGDNTQIVRLSEEEARAIVRLMHALTKTPLIDRAGLRRDQQEAMEREAVKAMNALSEVLEKGPVKLVFEPVEVSL